MPRWTNRYMRGRRHRREQHRGEQGSDRQGCAGSACKSQDRRRCSKRHGNRSLRCESWLFRSLFEPDRQGGRRRNCHCNYAHNRNHHFLVVQWGFHRHPDSGLHHLCALARRNRVLHRPRRAQRRSGRRSASGRQLRARPSRPPSQAPHEGQGGSTTAQAQPLRGRSRCSGARAGALALDFSSRHNPSGSAAARALTLHKRARNHAPLTAAHPRGGWRSWRAMRTATGLMRRKREPRVWPNRRPRKCPAAAVILT